MAKRVWVIEARRVYRSGRKSRWGGPQAVSVYRAIVAHEIATYREENPRCEFRIVAYFAREVA